MSSIAPEELIELQQSLETFSAEEVISFAVKRYGKNISLASSFGAEDMVLIHMLSDIKPGARVFLLDTGYLFKETHELIEKVKNRYNLLLDIVKPSISIDEMERQHGRELFKIKPDLCCKIRKIDPLKGYLKDLDAWITGVRREQTPMRAGTQKIENDNMFGLVKFNPLADWSSEMVWEYINTNDVPFNTLHDQDFPSIGCEPCTRKVEKGDDPRAGRWTGNEKTECGLHFDKDGKTV